MVCIRFTSFSHLLVFSLIILLASFSHARQVLMEVKVVTTSAKELAILAKGNMISLHKAAANVQNADYKTKGRKMSVDKMKDIMKEEGSRRMKVSKALVENWRENFMAFSADYRSPMPHPPKNN